MSAVLKRSLGEAGAFIDESNGRPSRLYEVLAALAEGSVSAKGFQAVIATAVLDQFIAPTAMRLQAFLTNAGTTGSAGSTVVNVDVDGTDVATLTTLNTDADGITKTADLSTPVDIAAGSVVKLEVTTAPTAGADLTATAMFSGLQVE